MVYNRLVVLVFMKKSDILAHFLDKKGERDKIVFIILFRKEYICSVIILRLLYLHGLL